ncbi:MAG: MATE family efflux transporter [Lachnospiraceae bacterium]|nr:MATE family efflux transporter [Lachnospiraceae bacterium]
MRQTEKENIKNDFTSGAIPKQLLQFALPLFAANLLQTLYNMVDMLVVGQFAGKVSLSAVSIGGDLLMFMTFFAMGFSSAGQVIIAQLLGSKQEGVIGKFVGTFFTFLLCGSLVLSVVCVGLRKEILGWVNVSSEAWSETMAYMLTCAVGLVFIYGYNGVSAVLRGMGDSRHPFLFIGISMVMNMILDLLLVGFAGMGAFGAAVATVVSQTFSFLAGIVFLLKNSGRLGFVLRAGDFLIDKDMLKLLVNLGFPMAISMAAIEFSKLFVNSWVNAYGVVITSVSGIGHRIVSVNNLTASAIGTASASMIGQNIGAGKYSRVSKTLFIALSANCLVAVFFTICILVGNQQIFGFFIDDVDVLLAADAYIPVAITMFFACATRAPMNGLIQGSANPKVNLLTSVMDGIVMRIGLAMLLGYVCGYGYIGYWMGDALAGFTELVIGGIFYLSGKWKRSGVDVK